MTDETAIAIEPGTEDDLPTIVDILNIAIASSDAMLDTEPITVAEEAGGDFCCKTPRP
jgi:L-amino acid N-acyltransferase YncA